MIKCRYVTHISFNYSASPMLFSFVFSPHTATIFDAGCVGLIITLPLRGTSCGSTVQRDGWLAKPRSGVVIHSPTWERQLLCGVIVRREFWRWLW